MPDASRRRFLENSARLAGRVAASGAVSLPILVALSKRAKAAVPTSSNIRCFLRGTQILTPNGEMPIEDLTIGSVVETLNGPLPVKWVGRQTFKRHSPSWHWSVAPIRIARFALTDEYPHRDLYLSPKHCLFIDGYLIAVEWLVNGRSIALATMHDREAIDYFHLELESHEVIFAEGTPAETLQVTNDREDFANFIDYERMYGRDEGVAMKPFAPILRYEGGRGELERLLRLAVSPFVDIRDPILRSRNRIAERAELVDI